MIFFFPTGGRIPDFCLSRGVGGVYKGQTKNFGSLVRPVNFILGRIFSPLQNARVPDIKKKKCKSTFFKVLGCFMRSNFCYCSCECRQKSLSTGEKNWTSKFDTHVHSLILIEKYNIRTAVPCTHLTLPTII